MAYFYCMFHLVSDAVRFLTVAETCWVCDRVVLFPIDFLMSVSILLVAIFCIIICSGPGFGDGVCFLQLDAIPKAASSLLALRFNNALYETVLLFPSIFG